MNTTPQNTPFKQTEIGPIPQDWEVVSLKNFIEKLEAGVSVNSIDEGFIDVEDEYSILKTSSVTNGIFKPQEAKKILPRDIKRARLNPIKDRIIISRMNTPDLVGECGYVNKTYFNLFLPDRLWMTFFRKDYPINTKWLSYILSYPTYRKKIQESATGTSNSMKNIAKDSFLKLQIPLPPLPEQTAIATALSDADALIGSLEKLIHKKRLLKQATLQHLLTPKEDWEVKKFNEVCWFQEGPGLRNWQFTKRGIKVINVTNLENGILNLDRTDRHISLEEFHKMYEHFEIDANDIVVASSGNSYGKVAVVRKQDLPLLMNTSVIRFKPLNNLDYKFLLTFLKSNQFKNQIDLLITGGAQPNFGPAHLNKILITLPSKIAEQTRIATILSDMDAELSGLEGKLEKYRQLKQGMMQQLLTGKIRLV